MKYFQPDNESTAEGAARIASSLLDAIAERLADGQLLSDIDIHEIRKTCKRLRALLRLLRPNLTAHEFQENDRKTRRLAIRLGPARDQAVMLATIDRLTQHYAAMLASDVFGPSREWLLQQQNSSEVHVAAHTLRSSLEDLRTSIIALDLQSVSNKTLLAGVVECYRLARKALRQVEQQPDNDAVHALRRHTKHLFNQLTMIADLDSAGIVALIDLSHSVEEALGQVHDLSVLTTAITGAATLRRDTLRHEILGSLLESRWIRQLSGSLRQANMLYDRKPGKFREWLAERLAVSG